MRRRTQAVFGLTEAIRTIATDYADEMMSIPVGARIIVEKITADKHKKHRHATILARWHATILAHYPHYLLIQMTNYKTTISRNSLICGEYKFRRC